MNKIRTAQVLMIVTMLLVITFQFYWIRKLYQEETNNFKTTADLLFRESLYKLQSQHLIMDNSSVDGLPGDNNNIFIDQVLKDITKVKAAGKDIIISINSGDSNFHKDFSPPFNHDSLIDRLSNHKFIKGIDSSLPHHTIKKFILNSKLQDTISLKSLDSLYSLQLKKSNYLLPFHLIKNNSSENKNVASYFQTNRIPVGFINPVYFSAAFHNYAFTILRKITFPIIFAIFLTALTLLSFLFLYKNLIAQKRLTEVKNEFIANITHELKTPISTVSVAIEAMKSFNVLESPQRTREYLDIAGLELNRLSMLVDKVLRLSMFESKKVQLKYQQFNIRDLTAEVIRSMQLQFERSDAEITLHTTGIDFDLTGDRMHITSVLYNLLDNSLKYSTHKPLITVNIFDEKDQIVIRVADNGTGIPEVFKEKVFEKFFRIPGGDQHNVKGYGLGLSYVAHIINEHKGTISINDNLPVGTIVNIHLPKQHAN